MIKREEMRFPVDSFIGNRGFDTAYVMLFITKDFSTKEVISWK